ncbi:MAG: hypothetical protein J7604_07020 [Sporocytophaga sp.]|uniref:hypothetical protein n=1 Tax=Sporocytophaga sp. TaxID=2231183 RepID=UPI001B2E6808|nr:hypothetical protein [Sporocytophaga sp.]MBO9699944.1 hypothetical protein [Sporocytophaga sp.]
MKLEDLNKIKIPPIPPRDCSVHYDKIIRLKIYLELLKSAENFANGDEALEFIQETIEIVEDYYSGIPKEINPAQIKSHRMYKAFDDNIEKRKSGGYIIITKGNVIEIEENGSFRIKDRKSGEIWLEKK